MSSKLHQCGQAIVHCEERAQNISAYISVAQWIKNISNVIYKSINFDSFSCPLHDQTYHVELSTCAMGCYALGNRYLLSCMPILKTVFLECPSDHVVFASCFL